MDNLKLLISVIFGLTIISCITPKLQSNTNDGKSQNEKDEIVLGPPIIKFENYFHDFGDIAKGDKRRHSFVFRNIGSDSLVIEIATSCDCTTLEYPTLPIPSGGKGEIKLVFNSSEKEVGSEIIDIDVIANTDPIVTTAQFKVNILAP